MTLLILSLVSFFVSFSLVKILQWVFLKDIFIKYILIDSLWVALYFGLCFSFNDITKIETNPWEDALLILLWIFIIPYLYAVFKKNLLKNHPKLSNMYYPIWEFMIFLIAIISWMALIEFLSTFFLK